MVMPVPMVDVRRVRMRMHEGRVCMSVRVRLAWGIVGTMLVTMMPVVHVTMRVRERLVRVCVLVPFRQMNPQPDAHERGGDEEQWRHLLVPEQNRACRTNEWREREIRSGSRGAEGAHREHEQHEAHTIAEEAECECLRQARSCWQCAAQ